MWVIGWLRYQNIAGAFSCFNEVMCSNVAHNFCTGIDLRVQLILQLYVLSVAAACLQRRRCLPHVASVDVVSIAWVSHHQCSSYIFIIVHLHDGRLDGLL